VSCTATTVGRRRLPAPIFLAIGLAWSAALAAHVGGFADHFHHDALVGDNGTISVATLAGYAAMWITMVAAMMLPSTVPLLRIFGEASSGQRHPGRLVAWLVAGYLVVWFLFGWIALGFDSGIHHTVDAIPWLADRPWLVGAATLALAGALQFSKLKDRCLTQCRHPAAYMLRHYRRGTRAAFSMGLDHGLYCLGCCWALMLVMFAAGVADLAWMAALGALMTYEKVGRHGQRVRAAAGGAAFAMAVLVAQHPAWLPPLLSTHAG
jgi:predicted metal-binding membrane protein